MDITESCRFEGPPAAHVSKLKLEYRVHVILAAQIGELSVGSGDLAECLRQSRSRQRPEIHRRVWSAEKIRLERVVHVVAERQASSLPHCSLHGEAQLMPGPAL